MRWATAASETAAEAVRGSAAARAARAEGRCKRADRVAAGQLAVAAALVQEKVGAKVALATRAEARAAGAVGSAAVRSG